jgi:hypothetical protein
MSAVRVGAVATLAAGMALSGGCSVLNGSASLTFRIDSMECSPAKPAGSIGTVCSFLAYYGNVGGHSIQVEPGSTRVLDRAGRTFVPVADAEAAGSFLLKPGLQHPISWSVTLPVNAKPARVTWHGSRVPVQIDLALNASAVPSVPPSASVPPSLLPSASLVPTSAAPTTTRPTTSKPVVTPTKTKAKTKAKPTQKPTPKRTPTPARTTTVPPTTPPPPAPTTTRPPTVHRTSAAPTTNSTNPGGGSGGIG